LSKINFGPMLRIKLFQNMDKLSMDKPEPLHDPPNCIKCGEKMRFSCTEIEKSGFVHHVYECKKCRSTQSFVTAK
jgi:hypothetical protein